MLAALVVLVLLALVAVECGRFLAGARQARRLRRAMHELRRPLQSISLSIEGRSPDLRCASACVEQARVALEDLETALERSRPRTRLARTALDEIAAALEDRWRFAGVHVAPIPMGTVLDADPPRLGAALDNLVANAIEHGSGPVSVRTLPTSGSVRIEVRDGGGAEPTMAPAYGHQGATRGNGLAIVAEVAARHGGTVIPPRRMNGGGTTAALSLPASATVARRAAGST